MKEVSKIKKIYEGFFGDEVSEEIAKERRKACSTCQFNSVNAEKLSLIGGIRKAFAPPFCTLCECQIHEKTGSPLEECAMYMIDEPKKWFKTKIETMEKDNLNLIQVNPQYDIVLSDNVFVINFGEVKAGENPTTEVIFEADKYSRLKLVKMQIACGCTSSSTHELNENSIQSRITLNISKVGMGAQAKALTLYYTLDGVAKTQKITLKAFRTA